MSSSGILRLTLHLTRTNLGYTLQVSDRLVSRTDGRLHDPLANKNIIYWARDALVVMAYTGTAYINGVPTDQRIVEMIRGEKYPVERPPAMLSMGQMLNPWWNIGQTIRLLQSELEDYFKGAPNVVRRHPFELVVAGWSLGWRNKREMWVWPFLSSLVKTEDGRISDCRPPRRWYLGRRAMLVQTPRGYITEVEHQQLLQVISGRYSDGEESANATEAAFVGAIRRVSEREPGVGSDCMSIVLPPPPDPVRIRYLPLANPAVLNPEAESHSPVAYSPWIVGQRVISPPSVMTGDLGWKLQMGGMSVHFDSPQGGPQPTQFTQSRQRREPPPR